MELSEEGDFKSSNGIFATTFAWDPDPLGTALRWSIPVYRRKYSVPTPNALCHIDGNHKLTRYRFVVYCCVDGHSRLIAYAP